MKPVVKRVAAITVIAGIVTVFIAAVAVSLLLESDRGRLFVQSTINERIDGSLSWSAWSISLWRGEIIVTDLAVTNNADRKIAGFHKLTALLSLLELFRGNLTFTWIVLEQPSVSLEQDNEGRINLLEAFTVIPSAAPSTTESDALPFPRNVVVRDGRLQEGFLSFFSEDEELRLAASGIALRFAGNLLDERGSMRLELEDLAIDRGQARCRLDSLLFEGTYRQGTLDNLSLAIKTAQSKALLRGSLASISANPALDLSLEGTLASEELREWFHDVSLPAGTLTVRSRLQGKLDNPDMDLVVLVEMDGGTTLPETVDARIRLSDRAVFLEKGSVVKGDCRLEIAGAADLKNLFPSGFTGERNRAGLDSLTYDLAIRLPKTSLRKLPFSIPAFPEGGVTASVDISGRGIEPERISGRLSARADIEDLRFDPEAPSSTAALRSELTFEGEAITLQSLYISAENASLSASGSGNSASKTINGSVHLAAPDMADLARSFGLAGLAGSLDLAVDLGGTLSRPSLHLRGTADALSYSDVPIGTVTLGARLDESGTVTLYQGSIIRGSASLDIAGAVSLIEEESLRLRSDPSFSVTVTGDHIRLEEYMEGMGGHFSIAGKLGGSAHAPAGSLTVTGKAIDTGIQYIAEASLAADIDRQGISFHTVRATTTEGEMVYASGRVHRDGVFHAKAATQGLALSSLDFLSDQSLFDGVLTFDVAGSGSFRDPKLDGTVALRRLMVGGAVHPDFEGRLSYADGRLHLAGHAGFSIDAAYSLEDGAYALSLDGDALDVAPYFQMAGIPGITGTLTAQVIAEGMADEPLNSRARAAVASIALASEDFGHLQARDIVATLEDRTATLGKTLISLPLEQALTLEGYVSLDGPVSLAMDGVVPLSLAGTFLDEVDDFSGSIGFSGLIGGTLAEPDMQADLVISNGAFRIYSVLSPRFHGINGAIRLERNRIVIETVHGNIDGGDFSIDGTIALRDLQPASLNIDVRGNALPFDVPDMLQGRLNTRLAFRGQDGRFELSGDVTIVNALYYRDITLRHISDVVTAAMLPAPPPPAVAKPLLDSVKIDVSVGHREPLSLSNNMAHLDLIPDLRLGGTMARPVLTGRVHVRSGTITYQRREFIVHRGVIDFLNPYRTEATFDIEGRATIGQRLITLTVAGPPEQLLFTLASTPPEDQADILSLLLTGKTTRELTGRSGDPMQTTAAMMAAIINAALADDVRRTTGLDIFEVEATGEDSDILSEQFRVTIGKELSRRLAVTYSFQTDQGELVQRVATEYRLLEHILAGAFQDNRGIFGGGIRFRLEFH